MTFALPSLWSAVGALGVLLLGLLTALLRVRPAAASRRRSFLQVNPRHRGLLSRLGLTEVDYFLSLEGVIVSGHTDRNVARLTLGDGDKAVQGFLKREHRVGWATRIGSVLAGFGFASRSLREARTLDLLVRAGVGCPDWIAVGEDGAGRAFLLLREAAGVDLRTYLAKESDPVRRMRLARRLGAAIARVHDCGFFHADLYSKHLLVQPSDDGVIFLDWQRARLTRCVDWRRRARDLAALHATLADDLAAPRERRAFLAAYRRAAPHLRLMKRRLPEPPGEAAPIAAFLSRIEFETQRLLRRRHIVEKRQPPGSVVQEWVRLEKQALCVTPRLLQHFPGQWLHWLSFNHQPLGLGAGPSRRWLPLPNGGAGLLVRRRAFHFAALLGRWRRVQPASQEQRQAELLLKLERYGVSAPRVLAMGQHLIGAGLIESFLFTEATPGTLPLAAWLARAPRGRAAAVVQTGSLLRRLHDAGCHLAATPSGVAFAVQPAGEAMSVVLTAGEGVCSARGRIAEMPRRDSERMKRALLDAGCLPAEVQRFREAVSGEEPSTPARDAAVVKVAAGSEAPGESLWRRLFQGVHRLRRQTGCTLFVGADWPEEVMRLEVTDRFHAKQGRSTGRVRFADADGREQTVYLKRHYRAGWWRGWWATVCPDAALSPALHEWQRLEWARRLGASVPRSVAAGERIGPWGRLQSFLAVEELTGMLPLDEAVPLASRRLDSSTFRRWKRSLIEEIVRLTRLLHDRRCFHKDLYLCHFYIPEADTKGLPASWRGRLHLIDLHRLAHHPWTRRLWQIKDLAQLFYSSEIEGVDDRDRLWFWRSYLGPERRRFGERWMRAAILHKARGYRRHNTRRKQSSADAPTSARR